MTNPLRLESPSINISGTRNMSTRSTHAEKNIVSDKIQVGLYPIALVLMIAGCASPTVAPQSNAPPLPITSFDGSYQSSIRVTGMSGEAKGTNWCETPGQPAIVVSNGQFTYAVPHPNVPGNPTPTFTAAIAQDGSFSGSANDGTISGKVTGTHIEGRIDGAGCIYAFAGDRT